MRLLDGCNRVVVTGLFFSICVLKASKVASTWIFHDVDSNELEQAREIGRKDNDDNGNDGDNEEDDADEDDDENDHDEDEEDDESDGNIDIIHDLNNDSVENSHYLDGLEQCNNIDRQWTDSIENEALRHGDVESAVWLQKAGMKEFTALFMTLPTYHMRQIAAAVSHYAKKEFGKNIFCLYKAMTSL
uniref:SAM domain-containing protein n=1 Tax=Angiostrongylus cantonensis TaxID=6313 RepID=A0A158P9V3_ANGCA